MISIQDYFQKPHSHEQTAAATDLIGRVNALANEAVQAGEFEWLIDSDTGCCISGRKGGDGDGGFRTPMTMTGGADSSHRILVPDQGAGVDVYDPDNRLDKWLGQFEYGRGGNSMLEKHRLYREHPDVTLTWCHLTTRAPKSGHRTFQP